MGHLAGETVISNISTKISGVFTDYDVIGRIGGDEFVVFLKNINSENLICKKADKLVQAFKEISIWEDNNYKLSGSIGIAKYPEHGMNFSELYTNADKALYESKNGGKDRYSIFNKAYERK